MKWAHKSHDPSHDNSKPFLHYALQWDFYAMFLLAGLGKSYIVFGHFCVCVSTINRGHIPNLHNINSSKKVRKLKFHRSYFSYYHTSNIVFDIIRKPVYLSLNWYHICNGYEFTESTLQLVLIESQKLNLAQHYAQAIVQTHWRTKTIGISLLCNTNELQDLIFELHSYPAALYIP